MIPYFLPPTPASGMWESLDLILLSFRDFNACVNKVCLVWEGGGTMHMALCDTSLHAVFPKRSHLCTSKNMDMLFRWREDDGLVDHSSWWVNNSSSTWNRRGGMLVANSAPSLECTFRKSRMPQYHWGVRGDSRLRWGVAVGRYQLYPQRQSEEQRESNTSVDLPLMGAESSLPYQACMCPVVLSPNSLLPVS